jgi:uncharacterized protein YkwD
MAVASPFSADRAEARPARSPALSTRLRVAWPREAGQAEAAFVADINGLRASRGLPVLQMRPNLTGKARRWAATMAAARRIRHSRISAGITGDWRKLGENVGMGASEPRLHAAFVASATHLQNLVDPAFRYVGVGVVAADDIMFVSQVFMQPSSTASRRPVRAPYRAVKRAVPVQQLQQGQHPLRPPTGTPGLLFRAIH